jgi:two-component system response regulator HydG
MITSGLLPLGARREARPTAVSSAPLIALDKIERQHISLILKETGFHKSRAAEILGISRKTLDRKIFEYGLGSDKSA